MNRPSRKSIRLSGWDYASSATYHVTICTNGKQPTLGIVTEKDYSPSICLSSLGKLCVNAIEDAANSVQGLKMHTYAIMPNHVHLLLSTQQGCNLSKVVTRIKAAVTRYTKADGIKVPIWQRGYYDHIIRSEADFISTWEYIENNPAKWADDELYVR